MTLISLDPERDTTRGAGPCRRSAISIRALDAGTPEPADVRAIAGLLGIRYRALADGDFNHTTVLVLLDA